MDRKKNITHSIKKQKKSNIFFIQNFFICKMGFYTILTGFLLFKVQPSYSVPSYARQTGMSCSSCHNMYPELTAFGREFKLNGYTLTGIKTIEEKNDKEKTLLRLLSISSFSAMLETSITHVDTKIPGTQNDNVDFPQQLSLFYAGLIAPHIGSFIQLTYSAQSATLGMDNVDIRYNNNTALGSKNLTYGFTLNNNPTVQDVWNSIPAWRFPYATSSTAPSPAAATMIDGALAQQVGGLGIYGLFNNLLYGEFTCYRTAKQGTHNPPDSTVSMVIKGVAPYGRLAIQHQWNKHYLEFGTSDMAANFYPIGVSGKTDQYMDFSVDLQYEYNFPKCTFILHPLWIQEKQTLNASSASGVSQNKSNYLNSFKINADLYFKKGINATIGYFMVNGNQDMGIYTPAEIFGSRMGKPDSDGIILEFAYLPWYNTKFSIQYIAYNKFNGSASNYDGFGRNASNNNTIYLLAWLCF